MTGPKRLLLHRIGIILLALPFAVPVTFAFSRNSHPYPILPVVFVAPLCASILVLNWVFFTGPERLKKKLPISSKELHRRKREFFDKLPG
jgi:hypothetical protein